MIFNKDPNHEVLSTGIDCCAFIRLPYGHEIELLQEKNKTLSALQCKIFYSWNSRYNLLFLFIVTFRVSMFTISFAFLILINDSLYVCLQSFDALSTCLNYVNQIMGIYDRTKSAVSLWEKDSHNM